ncbi:MAG: signal recognition particle-docking protein FtsY [Clostridia bacterium]|nr:signal recognition particle-docking protein FtsY [Clostridia bacterium]
MFKRLFGKKKKDEEKNEAVDQEAVAQETVLDEEWEDQPFRNSELGELFEEEEAMEDSFHQMAVPAEEIEAVMESLEAEPEEVMEEVVEEFIEEIEEMTEAVSEVLEEVIEEEPSEEEAVVEAPQKKGFFAKLVEGLNKTRKGITDVMDDLFSNYGEIDDDLFEELEEILIMADVGMDTTMKIIDALRDELKARKIKEASLIKEVLGDVLMSFMQNEASSHLNVDNPPSVVFVIGVNGAGKTTSIGKLAYRLKQENKSVLLAAADTFRAAAIDQLKVWGERTGVEVIAQQEGSDAASVVFDAIQAAKSRKTDVLVVDTAGRLHNKKNLMNELAKIFKIVNREYPEAEKEVLLVLDATTGQNAVQQAKLFKEAADITGLVLTKLDGTAKGGAVLAIKNEVGIPVKLVGVGEGINDLEHFEPESFVKALLELK